MALADTAKLVASLELQDKLSKPAANAERSMDRLNKKSGVLGKIGKQTSAGLGSAANNVKLLGIAAIGAIGSQVALGVQSLAQLAEVNNQTAAVIKSTNGAAGVTAAQIRKQSEDLEDLSTVDDKVIQAGENMLLTFTNVRNEVGKGNDIFTQASKTLLDVSTAMGTEPQQAAIQLGKALNDPVKGITALTRVGVAFTKEQQDQIKSLVKSGKTMEAQKIILKELNKEFGGSAEAFGKGPGATMRRFGDAVEGAQQALAKGFLPLIEKVSKKAQTLFNDPKVVAGIESFGTKISGVLDELLEFGSALPWGAIGDAFKLMGSGARIAIDAFKSAPPWLQTAIVTGWGLNKLTGGAAADIFGSLASGLIKGVLGMNAGVVNINAAVVNGGGGGVPGVPTPAGKTGAIGGVAKFVLGPAAAVVIGAEIAKVINDPVITPAKTLEQKQVKATIDSADLSKLEAALKTVKEQRNTLNSGDAGKDIAIALSYLPIIGDALGNVGPELDAQTAALQKKIDEVRRAQALTTSVERHSASEHNAVIRSSMIANSNRITHQIISHAASERADLRGISSRTAQAVERMRAVESVSRATAANTDAIRRKNFSPTVNVGVTNNISVRAVQQAIQTYTYATATGRRGGLLQT